MSVTLEAQCQSLFDAVLADPADDAPRLVLADWLQERGATEAERARGKFVALQVWLRQEFGTEWRERSPRGDRRRMWEEQICLWLELGREWAEADLRPAHVRCDGRTKGIITTVETAVVSGWSRTRRVDHPFSWDWERGWPDRLCLPWVAWLATGDALRKVWPITEVLLEGERPTITERPVRAGVGVSLDGGRWMPVATLGSAHHVALTADALGQRDHARWQLALGWMHWRYEGVRFRRAEEGGAG